MDAEPSFSPRAIATGVLVGAIGAVSNVYVSLKVGWSLPVMATAAIVGLAVARAHGRPLKAREAVVLTSLASSAAFLTGGGNLAALPALAMSGFATPGYLAIAVWFALTAVLGTLVGPFLGRRVRELAFPTATATATLVQTATDGVVTTRALWRSTIATATFATVRSLVRVPATLVLPGRAGTYTFGLDTSLLLVGVGGLMARRTAWSTLLGGIVTYGSIAPIVAPVEVSYRSLVRVMVWPAASLLVASSATELLLEAPRLFRKTTASGSSRGVRWPFVVPAALAVFGVVAQRLLFGVSWIVATASLPVALAIAYVAARSMGETDVVPTKALAPLAQGLFGWLERGVLAPTIAPNFTGAVAIHAADTLGSMKTARLLGAPVRTAIVARLAGCVLGAAVVVLTYRAVLPDPRVLPTVELPAPGVIVWKSVAEVIASGAFPPLMTTSMVAGAVCGVLLALLERFVPEHLRAFVPSPMGFGSGMVLPFSSSLSIAGGALVRALRERKGARETTVAVASGAVAGESLVGVVVQVLR